MSLTVILGASPKPDRYSHKAQVALTQAGHEVIPVHPTEREILGLPAINEIKEIWQPVDTITVYLSPARLAPLLDDIIRLAPKRIIFNPGTEIPELYHQFPDHIELLEACTLVLLRLGQY